MKLILLIAGIMVGALQSQAQETNGATVVVKAVVTWTITTNWQEVAAVVPVNGGYQSSVKRGCLQTNVTATIEWKGQIHQIGLETKSGPCIGTFLFEPSNVITPDGVIQGIRPTAMPPPLPR